MGGRVNGQRLLAPRVLINIQHVDGLTGIELDGNRGAISQSSVPGSPPFISLGALTTHFLPNRLLRRSPAMLPIPGTLSLEHLRENLGALDIELDDDEAAAIG